MKKTLKNISMLGMGLILGVGISWSVNNVSKSQGEVEVFCSAESVEMELEYYRYHHDTLSKALELGL